MTGSPRSAASLAGLGHPNENAPGFEKHGHGRSLAKFFNLSYQFPRGDGCAPVRSAMRSCEAFIDAGEACTNETAMDYAAAKFARAMWTGAYFEETEHLLLRYIESRLILLDEPIRSAPLFGNGMLPLDAALSFCNVDAAAVLIGCGASSAHADLEDWAAFEQGARPSLENVRAPGGADGALARLREARMRWVIASGVQGHGATSQDGASGRKRHFSL